MKTSATGLVFDYYHNRDNASRRALYERKKATLRQETAGWPEVPPEDLDALPASVRWWWRTLTALRQEHRRATRGLALVRLIHNPRRASPKVTVLQPKRKAQ